MISADSQIYYDLNIYGDDFYELVRWMHEDFGVQTMSVSVRGLCESFESVSEAGLIRLDEL